jgi:GT2 family glycosyltransferase
MTTADQITVVTVTFNSRHCLPSLQASLAQFGQIIVVDNGSHDGTAEALASALPQARLIASPVNLGFGRANNVALAQVHTPYALLLNPDCVVPSGLMQDLLQATLAHPEAAIIAPHLQRGTGKLELSYRWPGKLWRSKGPATQGACCVGFVSGAAMLLNMAVMREVGFFDEHFFLYYEDEDLCQRVFAQRKQIIVLPYLELTHLSRGSVKGKNPLKSEFIRGYHHAQSKLLFEHKHVSAQSAQSLRYLTLGLACLTLLPRLLLPQPKYLARLIGRICGLCRPYPQPTV